MRERNLKGSEECQVCQVMCPRSDSLKHVVIELSYQIVLGAMFSSLVYPVSFFYSFSSLFSTKKNQIKPKSVCSKQRPLLYTLLVGFHQNDGCDDLTKQINSKEVLEQRQDMFDPALENATHK